MSQRPPTSGWVIGWRTFFAICLLLVGIGRIAQSIALYQADYQRAEDLFLLGFAQFVILGLLLDNWLAPDTEGTTDG